MPAKVRYSDRPFGDRGKLHEQEMRQVRRVTASWIRAAFGIIALTLVLGIVLVVLGNNISTDTPLVRGVWSVCGWFDGPFSRDAGLFRFHGANAANMNAIANWGTAALIYLVVGGILRSWLRRG